MQRKNNFRFFSTEIFAGDNKVYETDKFLTNKFSKNIPLFYKNFLLASMTHNVIYFCYKKWELANLGSYIRPVLIYLNNFETTESTEKLIFAKTKGLNDQFEGFFLSTKIDLIDAKKNLWKPWNFFLKLFKLLNLFLLISSREVLPEHNTGKNIIFEHLENNISKKIVWAFLVVRATWNNFFVTIIDNKGNVLVTRSGGNSERFGTRQRATVFSADSAVYEACFIARGFGIEALSIHIWSTLRLPQIKNCFDGLEATGITIHELIYRPIWAFGGCRKKKPRRV